MNEDGGLAISLCFSACYFFLPDFIFHKFHISNLFSIKLIKELINAGFVVLTRFSRAKLYAYLWGYAFSLFVPLYPLKWISVNLWLALAINAGIPKDDAVKEHRVDLPLLIGLLERFIYTAAFVSDRDSLIGVWLALKVIGNWKRWSDGFTYKTDANNELHVAGRNISNVFILGSGLSLAGAWVGAQIIEWIKANQLWESLLGALTYFLVVLAIAGYAKYIVKKLNGGRVTKGDAPYIPSVPHADL